MPRQKKWIQVPLDAPWSVAAREILGGRLDHLLRRVKRTRKDRAPEDIHQLRVSSRRATAALDIFADVTPASLRRKLRNRLKHIRRAAGAARDLDVLRARLHTYTEDTGATLALKRAAELTDSALHDLERLGAREETRRLRRNVKKLLHGVAPRDADAPGGEFTLSEAARSKLLVAVDAFFAAGSADLSDVDLLHAFRIAGKNLRYSMELFSGVLPKVLTRKMYRDLEVVQETLGKVNDLAVAIDHYSRWQRDCKSDDDCEALARLRNAEEAALREARHGFLLWWTPDRADAMRLEFHHLLSAPVEKNEGGTSLSNAKGV